MFSDSVVLVTSEAVISVGSCITGPLSLLNAAVSEACVACSISKSGSNVEYEDAGSVG